MLNVANFLEDLNGIPFNTVINAFDDVDNKLYAFQTFYLNIVDEHAPMKYARIRGNQVPYMTEQWRKAIRHRNHF